MRTLTELYNARELIRTAHRGASFSEAENTLSAFRRAVEYGADFIEFDLYGTADGVPVVLHDGTIDRTSDGKGAPWEMTLAELRKYNFSYFYQGERHEKPLHEHEDIPTFEDVLKNFRGKACMNIQLYDFIATEHLAEICRLYMDYGMKDNGYLTIARDSDAAFVRKFSKDIEICLTPGWLERSTPENLKKCADLGCRFVQPILQTVTEETLALCKQYGLRPNAFFTDSPEKLKKYQAMGLPGILTNRIERFPR